MKSQAETCTFSLNDMKTNATDSQISEGIESYFTIFEEQVIEWFVVEPVQTFN